VLDKYAHRLSLEKCHSAVNRRGDSDPGEVVQSTLGLPAAHDSRFLIPCRRPPAAWKRGPPFMQSTCRAN